MKILTAILIGLFLISAIFIFNYLNNHKEVKIIMENNEEKVYQGPVRPTDDEAYFRKTGITRPLEVKE